MKWLPKQLRESKFKLERVQIEPIAIRLFTNATFVLHPTIGLTTTHIGKQLWKCSKGRFNCKIAEGTSCCQHGLNNYNLD
jgi:hypothetical protein